MKKLTFSLKLNHYYLLQLHVAFPHADQALGIPDTLIFHTIQFPPLPQSRGRKDNKEDQSVLFPTFDRRFANRPQQVCINH